jgi:hypothetical protein
MYYISIMKVFIGLVDHSRGIIQDDKLTFNLDHFKGGAGHKQNFFAALHDRFHNLYCCIKP